MSRRGLILVFLRRAAFCCRRRRTKGFADPRHRPFLPRGSPRRTLLLRGGGRLFRSVSCRRRRGGRRPSDAVLDKLRRLLVAL
jgi:hypothetical protein